jgi:hypothetical protein
MVYVVYDSSTLLTHSFHAIEAEATAVVAKGEGLAVSPDASITREAVPKLWYWNAVNSTVSIEPIIMTTELENLQAACNMGLSALSGWRMEVDAIEKFWPSAVVAKADDWLAWGCIGFTRVMLSTYWSSEQRIAFAAAMAQGSAGLTSAVEFFESAKSVTVPAPTSATVWASPEDATRWFIQNVAANVALIEPNMADAPAPADLVSGAWVDDVQTSAGATTNE